MQDVTLIMDPLGPPEHWEALQVSDVRDLLMERFSEWPSSARIYHGVPASDRDVTPRCAGDVGRLAQYDELTVVIYPGDPVTAIIAVVAIIVAVAASLLLMPKIPSLKNDQQGSPNNGLSARSNRARPNGRVPDIYGQVRAVPDLIAAPYRVYESHRELEIAYMCIGRGAYEVEDIRDGDTLISDITLASCAVYGPYSSPNDFTLPDIQIGSAIGDPVFNVRRLNEVNGETMKAPNARAVALSDDLTFGDGGVIESAGGLVDFTDYFMAGDLIDIGGAQDPGGDASDTAVLASGVAHSSGFDFASYDPTADFAVGNIISITGAVYQFDDGGTSGSLGGSVTYPSYPINSGGRTRGQIP